jgi:hypothetical protein
MTRVSLGQTFDFNHMCMFDGRRAESVTARP